MPRIHTQTFIARNCRDPKSLLQSNQNSSFLSIRIKYIKTKKNYKNIDINIFFSFSHSGVGEIWKLKIYRKERNIYNLKKESINLLKMLLWVNHDSVRLRQQILPLSSFA